MSIFNSFPNTTAILQMLGGNGLTGLLGNQQQAQTNPLATLLGGQQQASQATGGLDTILSQYLGLGTAAPQPTVAPTETITLPTFDVNFIRQLGDDVSLGGNADGKLRKAELNKAVEFLTNVSSIFGDKINANFKSILKKAKLLSNDAIASQISGKDGNNADISAQDIVVSAQGDADKKLETIQVTKPGAPAVTPDNNNILELIIRQILGF